MFCSQNFTSLYLEISVECLYNVYQNKQKYSNKQYGYMSNIENNKLINRARTSKCQDCHLYDTWNFFVGKGSKQVKVCVHLDMKEMPAQESIVKELVRYLQAFENIRKTGTYNE